MKLEPQTIYSFKLTSGEEIVARVTDCEEHSLRISDPVSVVQGPQGMGLLPSFFTADPNKHPQLNTQAIVLVSETDAKVAARYQEATSGIKIAPKSLVLG
jgi:hypothetical protein